MESGKNRFRGIRIGKAVEAHLRIAALGALMLATTAANAVVINGSDLTGGNLTPGDGDVLSGAFINVGNFSIGAGTTVYVMPGVALVGDAAHVIHPLAGQGVNLGFLDAGSLVDALQVGRARGRRPGTLRDLRAYERGRKGHNTATQLVMDGFKHLFGSDAGMLALARNLGLGVAGRVPILRRTFERVALGYGLELPSLCRPAG